MNNHRSKKSGQELFDFAAQVLGNHYRQKALSDTDRLEDRLRLEVEAFKASRRNSRKV